MAVQFAHGQSVRSPRGPAGVDFYIGTGRCVSRIYFMELSNLSLKVVWGFSCALSSVEQKQTLLDGKLGSVLNKRFVIIGFARSKQPKFRHRSAILATIKTSACPQWSSFPSNTTQTNMVNGFQDTGYIHHRTLAPRFHQLTSSVFFQKKCHGSERNRRLSP